MRIDIITCVPALLESPFAHSMVKKALQQGQVTLYIHDLRDYTADKHRKVDDYVYGGGAGMLLKIEPIVQCINTLKREGSQQAFVYMTPDGELLNQKVVNQLSLVEQLVVLCGHYKGIDERVREHWITHEISIGDYVLSGGELAAAVLVDAIVRLVPGVLSDGTSALTDSFQNDLLAPPAYTRPAIFQGLTVPDVLLSGHAQAIAQWRYQQAVERTQQRRPDLYQAYCSTACTG